MLIQKINKRFHKRNKKNLKRVAAGKAVAERTRIAREAQKKALAFANSVLISAEVDKQFLN